MLPSPAAPEPPVRGVQTPHEVRHIRQIRSRHVQAGTAGRQYQPVREEHSAVRPPIPRQADLGPGTVVGTVDGRRGGPVREPQQPVPLPPQSTMCRLHVEARWRQVKPLIERQDIEQSPRKPVQFPGEHPAEAHRIDDQDVSGFALQLATEVAHLARSGADETVSHQCDPGSPPRTSRTRERGLDVVLVEVLSRGPRDDRRTKVGETLPVPRAGVDPDLVATADQLGDQT